MDLEVVGRHALLFDDDSMAAFVNSADALVEWNSLSIDRYDVRHLLSAPPPPRNRRRHLLSAPPPPRNRRRHQHSSPNRADDALESELEHERYLDLPSSSEDEDLENEESENPSGYNAVGFSYGDASGSLDQKSADMESGFRPPFSVPESLLVHLPPTEKVHQIIVKTAMFVSKHGGQSEIVLRVKQGDNPTFGFLLPDHNLHPYFRFLVAHKELLESEIDGKSTEENKTDGSHVLGGALSLLGSVYGTGEDEEAATEDAPALTKTGSSGVVNTEKETFPHESENQNSSNAPKKDYNPSKPLATKDKSHVIKRYRPISGMKSITTAGAIKDGDSMGASSTVDKLQPLVSSKPSKVEPPILEPPTDMKRVVEKIVEFILRNGKEFEAVLVQQDTKHGRFPFLLPSHVFHRYYRSILQKAEEAKSAGKSFSLDKQNSPGRGIDKKSGSRDDDSHLASDMPFDPDRKEKFKMVLGKSKKDGQDPPPKPSLQPVGVSVDAVAAILQAARKGIKTPSLEMLSKSITASNQVPSSEGSNTQKPDNNKEPGVSVPVAKAIAKTAATAAANEADSSEASLSKEQKLKAERLKRAKMFAAMVKSGAAPLKTEPLRGLSVEPPESGFSGSMGPERVSSSAPLDLDNSSDKTEKAEKKESAAHDERRLKRSYRSRSKRDKEEEDDDDSDDDDDEDPKHKHSRRKRHHKSHRSKDRHKHRKPHSSTRDSDSEEKPCSSDEDEQRRSRRKHRHRHRSSDEDEHRPSRHRRRGGHDEERRRSRHRHRHNASSDEDRAKSRKHRKKSESERDRDLEEGEIVVKSDQSKGIDCGDGGSREVSIDLSKSQPFETTQVSDDLRAKIRAMLMATL